MGFLIFIILCYIVYKIFWFISVLPGRILKNKFATLGELSGQELDYIISVVGKPSAVSSSTDKKGNPTTVCQWLVSGFHIVLLFDKDEKCLGINHVSSQ